ncbi:MAG TPA: PQQ-dependent sugar dehydrogenase [Chloroflexota bacterium]|nr:PQQ-dependent sugar dehydrogenase [Chloroflexota bacterium]
MLAAPGVLLLAAALAVGAPGGPAASARHAAALPLLAETRLVGGLEQPTALAHAGDGSGRLYVAERAGQLRVVRGGVLRPEPVLDIRDRVDREAFEQGLLGVAFPPGPGPKEHVFLHYTNMKDEVTVSRFRLSDGETGDPASEEKLIALGQDYANHNGGQLAFGPDGYLYVGIGDGDAGGDPRELAQDMHGLHGKLLRLDVTSEPGRALIPPTNPFVGRDGVAEIWALGLRQPWRFSFDRATGDLYLGDVGEDSREEIDLQPAGSAGGENYGWPLFEGTRCRLTDCGDRGFVPPVAEYTHADGCAVVGGYVYRGERFPALRGVYLYGDFCTGRVWGLQRSGDGWERGVLLESGPSLMTFGEDERGELYLADAAGVWALGRPGAPRCEEGGGAPPPTPAAAHRLFLPAVARGCGPA